MTYDSHHVCLKSCIGSCLRAWLFTHLVIPSFCMTSNIFSLTLCTKLGPPHPMIIGLTHYICGQSLNLMGIHILQCFHGKKCIIFHDVQNVFLLIVKDVKFHIFHEYTHIFPIYLPSFNSHNNLLTLCYSLLLMLSLLIPLE
jgi:hypothetical protein